MTDTSTQGTNADSTAISVEDLSDEDLVEITEKMKKDNRMKEIENIVFENFLLKNEPRLLYGIQAILEQIDKLQGKLDHAQLAASLEGVKLTRSMGSLTSIQSKLSALSFSDASKRINLPTKLELLTKDREAYKNIVEEYHRSVKIKRDNLKAELEEINLRIAETKEARDVFEQSVVKEGADRLTQKIPAEKFIRYVEEWLKSADSIYEKLRLRTSTLKYRKIFLKNQLKQKEELGESLHPVDLDQLKIDNQVLNKKLEQKNIDLLELKKNCGEVNLDLSNNKIFLLSKTTMLNKLKTEMIEQEEKIENFKKEVKLVQAEVKGSKDRLHYLENLIDKYTVPELEEYIRKKSELYQLSTSRKVWFRRNCIQQTVLESLIKTMKRLTRCNNVMDEWFAPPRISSEDDDQQSMVQLYQ